MSSNSSSLDPDVDLPLLANSDQLRVRHYVLRLVANMDTGGFDGEVVVFLEDVSKSHPEKWKVARPELAPSSENSEAIDEKVHKVNKANNGMNSFEKEGTINFNEEESLNKVKEINEEERISKVNEITVSRIDEDELINATEKTVDRNQVRDVVCDTRTAKKKPFRCILDCRHLHFLSVEELIYDEAPIYFRDSILKANRENGRHLLALKTRRPLTFEVKEWSLEIEAKDNNQRGPSTFPSVLRLRYKTLPSSSGSIHFRRDASGHLCAFTPASPVNNRALFPCQEPPTAMATWQAEIIVPEGFQVFCTGDEEGCPEPCQEGRVSWYFYTRMVLPMSTFALAIGQWEILTLVTKAEAAAAAPTSKQVVPCQNDHADYPCHIGLGDRGPLLPCRLAGPMSLLVQGQDLRRYVRACLEAAREVLGPHPFGRLDIVVLPRCFSGAITIYHITYLYELVSNIFLNFRFGFGQSKPDLRIAYCSHR